MTTTWDTVHRRTDLLHHVVAELDAGANELPWTPELEAEFGDRDRLLLALQDLWSRGLEGRIHLGLEMDDHELTDTVADAWRFTAERLPGVRRILDLNATATVLQHAVRVEAQMVAVAAGLAAFGDPVGRTVALGQTFVRGLRADGKPARRVVRQPLVVRLREAWAR